MNDLMYFGYDYDKEARGFEIEFKEEIKKKFPSAVLTDAFDYIKGYRQEVRIDDIKKDDYYCWIIAKGWFQMSFSLSLLLMNGGSSEYIESLIEKTKLEYPESIKN